MPKPLLLLIALTTVVLVLASCSDAGDDSLDAPWAEPDIGYGDDPAEGGRDLEAAEPDAGAPPVDAADGAERSAAGEGAPGTAPAILTAADIGRSIIYTATIEVVTDDVSGASRQAQQAIASLGGLLFGQESSTDPRPRTTLVFRVPPADFQTALDRLSGIGEVTSQQITADDVTDRVVDLRSRILTAEVSVERLRRLLEGATTVEAIAALEAQLLERETSLELLRGQLRSIEAQVSLATIYLTISEKQPPAPEPALDVEVTGYAGDDRGARCPGERRLRIDEGDDLVICVKITNTGNVAVRDIEVRDPGLDLTRDDFTLLDHDPEELLEPDQSVIAWATVEVGMRTRPWPQVSAVPVDAEGEALRIGIQINETPIALEVIEDDSLPGFGDSVAAGWRVLQRIFGVLVVLAGAFTPLALVAAVPAGFVVWWRRRDVPGTGERDDTEPREPAPF